MKMNKKWNIFISILLISVLSIVSLDVKKRVELKPQTQTIVIEESVIPNEYLGEFVATYYTHTGNRTSTGVYPKANRTIAVDPKKIPYGTYLYVDGHGVYIAEDCGGDIKGHRLDIFVDTHKEAIQLGRKTVKVWKLTKQ